MNIFLKSIFLTFICISVFIISPINAYADQVPQYEANMAISYAEKHWNDKSESDGTSPDCVEFVRTCVQYGGLPEDTARIRKEGSGYTVSDYVKYITDNGYGVLNKLETELSNWGVYYVNSSLNQGKVSPGDIIVYKCVNKGCSKGYIHMSLCAYENTSGTYAGIYNYYAHNVGVNNKPLCTIKHSSCGGSGATTEVYALHITSPDNGFTDSYNDSVSIKVSCEDYNKLRISWDPIDSANKYNVFVKKSSKSFFRSHTQTSSNSAIYTVPADEYAKTIYFAVRPCSTISGKDYVGNLSNISSGYTVASKPSNLKTSLTSYNNVKVTWAKTNGATGYKVEYKSSSSSKWSFLKWTTSTYVTKSSLSPGKKYFFRITPYTTSKGYTGKRLSPNSAESSIYTLKKISTPVVKKYSKSKVKLNWTNISGESGYQISRSTSKSKADIVKTISTTSGKSAIISASKGKKYYYKVRAYKISNGKKIYGPWSSVKYYKN